jgi:Xaa-Pro aminopeptidase
MAGMQGFRRERVDPGSIDPDSPYHPDLDAEVLGALRRGRLERLQDAMRSRSVAGCLFFAPANIRYATGTDVMGVWPARYQAQRYPSLGHHAGLEVEGPDLPHPDDGGAWTPELREMTIEPGMVLSLQCYAGIERGRPASSSKIR